MDKDEFRHFGRTIGFLTELYEDIAVDEFSPKKLKTCRCQMVRAGSLCRGQINKMTRRIVRLFKWGGSEELVRGTLWKELESVDPLRKGEEGTKDHPPRQAVPDEVVAMTLPFMSPTVAAMTQVQGLPGMRSCEVYRMRVGEIDQSREAEKGLWYYTPESHKTEKYIGKKEIALGKPEQELIAPYLIGKQPEEAVFSPRTAMEEHHAERRASRTSKVTPSQQERNRQRAEKTTEQVGDFYDANSYRKAIAYAIKKGNKAGVEIPHWTPYQLRHNGGTYTEKTYGLDAAQAQLGHTSANMTKRYAHGRLAITEKLAQKRVNRFAQIGGAK
jgi:integrase